QSYLSRSIQHWSGLGKVQVVGDLMYVPGGSAGLHIVRLHLDRFAASAAIGTSGGMVTTVDGSVNLNVPPGAVASTTTLTITPALDPALLPDAGGGTLRAITLDARDSNGQSIAQFGQPYTLSISYTDTQVAALKINEASLHTLYWNGNSWSAAP